MDDGLRAARLLQGSYDRLLTAISASDPIKIARRLYEKNILQQSVLNNITQVQQTDDHRSLAILTPVRSSVEVTPTLMSPLLEVLDDSGNEALKQIVREIRLNCKKLGKTCFNIYIHINA